MAQVAAGEPLSDADRLALDNTIRRAEQACRFEFSVYVGPVDGEDARAFATRLHNRLVGKPGRLRGLQRFLDHVAAHDRVWVCRRVDIARHWLDRFPPGAA